MRKVLSVFLSFVIIISVQSGFIPEAKAYTHTEITSETYNSPSVYPTRGEHPRVLFNSDDIADIKKNLSGSENYNAYENFKMLKDDSYSISDLFSLSSEGTVTSVLYGNAPKTENETVLARLEAKAFDYVINGNRANGAAAISGLREFLDTVVSEGTYAEDREIGYIIFVSSEIYDWCYDLLTTEDIESIVEKLIGYAGELSCGYPPKTSMQNPISGHGAEAMVLRDLYSFSIAVYDEYPDIYEYIQSYIEQEYVEVRNLWYASGSHHQGTSYGGYRFEFDMWSAWLYRAMCGKELYSSDMQYSLYQLLYYVAADGQLFSEGDYTPITVNYTGGRIGNSQVMWLAANYFNDPYLKAEQIRTDYDFEEFDYFEDSKSPVQFLIINNPELEAGDRADLSKTRFFGYPNGTMVAKTGWESLDPTSSDVSVYMKIGQEYMGNHQHLDFGTFQIYYKGMLTANQGLYRTYASDHDANYNKETISHNGLLIFDPDEEQLTHDARATSAVNSGGQRRTYRHPTNYESWKSTDSQYGTVTAWGYDTESSTPAYSYISGDITNAYSDKVSEVRRSMLFMPTNDSAMPAVFFVADKVVSTDESFKKTFLLQAPVEATVSGNTTTIKRTHSSYNGKLTVQTLFPENPEIVAQGGEGFQWYAGGNNIRPLDTDGVTLLDDSNLDYGWGKVLISPSVEQEEDYFLNAMYVSNSGYFKNPVAVSLENDEFIGGELADKIALFAKSSDFLKGEFSLPIEASKTAKEVVVTGLYCGVWEIYENNKYVGEYVIDDDSSLIHFTTSGGEITINYTTLDEPVLNTDFLKDEEGNRVISWEPVSGAVDYNVVITDADGDVVYSSNTDNSTSCTVSSDTLPAGIYTVSVKALSYESKYDSSATTASLNAGFGGGQGTSDSPYIISDEEEFLYLKDNSDASNYYIITEDIDLTQVEFTPFAFSGNIKGWNTETEKPEIKNINYVLEYSVATDNAGLFTEVVESSCIGYLSVSGSIYSSAKISQAGGFAGRSYASVTFENLINNVTMSGSIQYGGGIVGNGNSKSVTIKNCLNNADLSGTSGSSRIGGIACVLSSKATVTGCVNLGNITGKYNAAGIVAWSYTGEISECYNMGDITSLNAAKYDTNGNLIEGGGITGAIVGIAKQAPNITNCYNGGTLTSNSTVTVSSAYGGVLDNSGTAKISGYYDSAGYGISDTRVHYSGKTAALDITYENCYVLSDTESDTEGVTALSEEQMKDKTSFIGFDFEEIWISRPSASYPYPMLISNVYDNDLYLEKISVLSGTEIIKSEILDNLGETVYNQTMDKAVAFAFAKVDAGEGIITEFGFEINGSPCMCESSRIDAEGRFGMMFYAASSGEYNVKAYVKYTDGSSEKTKYLECEDALALSVPALF